MATIIKEVEFNQISPTNIGMQSFNPMYRNMDLSEIVENSRIETEYVPYGYNVFLFVRNTATIHAYNK